jgi:hypothetical protein
MKISIESLFVFEKNYFSPFIFMILLTVKQVWADEVSLHMLFCQTKFKINQICNTEITI